VCKITRVGPRAKASRAVECRVLRQVRLVRAGGPGQPWSAVEITTGKETALYAVKAIRSEIGGRAFELVKQGEVEDGEGGWYHVLVDDENTTCDCKGFLRWAHCKHEWACSRLAGRGLL
jgi:hypothetical protein